MSMDREQESRESDAGNDAPRRMVGREGTPPMENAMSRRHLLTSTLPFGAFALIGSAPAVASSRPRAIQAAGPSPDASLLELVAELKDLEQAHDALVDRMEPLSEAFERQKPERPAALTWTYASVLPAPRNGSGTFSWDDIDRFREWPRYQPAKLNPRLREQFARDAAEAQVVIDAWDGWQAELAALRERLGIAALEREAQAISNDTYRMRRAIVDSEATTLDGLRAKSEVVADCFKAFGGVESEISADLDEGVAAGETVAASIVRDLLRLAIV